MMIKKYIFILFQIIAICAAADEISLTIPSYVGYEYFQELLEKSLAADGHTVTVNTISDQYEEKRVNYLLENQSRLNITWSMQSPDMNYRFMAVEVDLTNGIAGNRIIFIPRGKQGDYDSVKTLDDFKNLNKKACGGKSWADAVAWGGAGLQYFEKDGSWDPELYKIVAMQNRKLDYFPRGAHEIYKESRLHPELDIEKNLVFHYKNDIRFYISRNQENLKPILENALNKAQKSGLIAELIKKHFPEMFDKELVNLGGRIKIELE